jgi:hypothetical protein
MSYSSGSASNANSASAFLALLDTLILSVTGWSKVSTAIIVGTNTWNVYKSSGANNSFGTDFYVALGYPTAAPVNLLMTIMESWNTGTLLASNYPPNIAQVPTGVFANPGAAQALPSTGTTFGYLQTAAAITTAFSYFMSVTADRIIFSLLNSTAASMGYYIGLYDSFNTVAVDPFPICVVNIGTTGSASVGAAITSSPTAASGLATREPAQAISGATNFSVGCNGGVLCSWTLVTSAIDVYKGFYYVSRCMLIGRASSAFKGLLKDCFQGPLQLNNGDLLTWTLAGTSYTAVRAGGSSLGTYFLTI